MLNNIAKTTKTLNKSLGNTTVFTEDDDIDITTGTLGLGLLVFDTSGTLGTVTSVVDDENFTVTTSAISIDVPTILSRSY